MIRYPNGNVEYIDSPLFIRLVLGAVALFLALCAWASVIGVPPHYIVTAVASVGALLCLAGVIMQQRTTFLFDPSIKTMTWTTRGPFRSTSGEVAFKDLGVIVGEMEDSKSGTTYRVVLTTPSGQMPLTQTLIGNRGQVERQAAEIRALISV